jgi:hypothetical protein
MRHQCNIALPFDQAPHHQFQQRPRHGQIIEPEVARRKRIEAWQFEPSLRADPHANGPGALKFCFQLRQEFDECVEAPSEQNVNLSRLGRADARDWLGRQSVTLKHSDSFEERRQGFRCGEPANAGSDHDRVSAEQSWHTHFPTKSVRWQLT